jgi:hypothetical protein
MRSVLISRFAHTCTGVGCPAGIAPKGTVAGLWSETLGHHASTFLHPFAPPELPGFHATMDALTPADDPVPEFASMASLPYARRNVGPGHLGSVAPLDRFLSGPRCLASADLPA